MQFTGHPLPVHQFVTVPWDFNPVHIVSQARPHQWNMQLPPYLEWHVWPGRKSIYNIKSIKWITRRYIDISVANFDLGTRAHNPFCRQIIKAKTLTLCPRKLFASLHMGKKFNVKKCTSSNTICFRLDSPLFSGLDLAISKSLVTMMTAIDKESKTSANNELLKSYSKSNQFFVSI